MGCHYPLVALSPDEPVQPLKDHAGWQLTLYGLIALQALSIAAFCVQRLLHYRIPPPFAMGYELAGAIAFLGTLLWCSESVITRPLLTRLAIRSILITILLWAVCFILVPFNQKDRSGERKADAARAFRELVAEQKLPAPASEPDISWGGRHREFVSIRYNDTTGQEQRLFVTSAYERQWLFRNLPNGQKFPLRPGIKVSFQPFHSACGENSSPAIISIPPETLPAFRDFSARRSGGFFPTQWPGSTRQPASHRAGSGLQAGR